MAEVSPGVKNAPHDTLIQGLPSVVLLTENLGMAFKLATIHAE